MVRLDDSRFVINGPVGTADNAGHALHPLDREGRIVLSFEPYVTTPREPTWMRAIGLGPSGLWSIPAAHGYHIRLFDPEEGRLLREFAREAEWYPPVDHFQVPTPERPPGAPHGSCPGSAERSFVDDGEVPQRGLVRRTRAAGADAGRSSVYPYRDNDVYGGVIEVLDAMTGELVVSARTRRALALLVAPGLIAFTREDSIGWWYADLCRLRLSRP